MEKGGEGGDAIMTIYDSERFSCRLAGCFDGDNHDASG